MRRWIGVFFAPSILAHQLGLRPAECAVRIERGVTMETFDGITLVSDIYHPRRADCRVTRFHVWQLLTLIARPYGVYMKNKSID